MKVAGMELQRSSHLRLNENVRRLFPNPNVEILVPKKHMVQYAMESCVSHYKE